MREMDPQPASLSPNPASSSSASRGMTVSAVARIFIVFLLVFGPYLGSLFSFSWQILPAVQAADTASVSSEAVSATNTGPVRSPIRAPQPRVNSVSCPAWYTDTTAGPVKGVFGQIYDKSGGTGFQLYFTATLLDANNYSVIVTTDGGINVNQPGLNGTQGVFHFTTPDDASNLGGRNEISNPAPSNKLMILQFDGLNNGGTVRQSSYFDYFKGGGFEVGRYSKDTATRFFLASDCTAYALIDHQAALNNPLLITAPLSIAVNNGITLPANTDIITMTANVQSSNNNRTFDGIIIQGRNIGGRLFQDYGPGNTNPPPYYPYPGGDVSIAAYKSPLSTSQPVTFTDTENPNDNPSLVSTQIVDAEGYYNLFGRDDTRFIPANATASYLLRLRGQTPGQLATELYCSYFYRGQTTEQSNGFQISYATVVTTSATGPQGPILTPPTTGNTVSPSGPYTPAPCYSSNASDSLHQPGYHFVVRGDIQIRGTITMTGRTDPSGAYAAAIDPATKQVAAVSDPVASDGNYKILNLRPGTVYGVEFFPPAGTTNPAYIPSFYNGKELDQTPSSLPTTTVAVGASTISGINGTINHGWAFQGKVSFNPGGGGVQATDVQVQVFKTADLLGNALNPVPLTQVAPDVNGNYLTDSVMEPGISYTLAFVPNNTASGYKVSWCGSNLGSCNGGGQATAAAAGGHLVSSSEGGGQRQIGANVTLFQGVQFAGTINGAGDTALHLSKGGGAAIYIYQVGLSGNQIISSSLAQYFGVNSNSNNITYTSAAVEIGQNYVIQAVPTNNDSPSDPGDPGYRSGYYCGANCGNGNYGLNQAAAVVGNSPGVVGNLNITLSRAAAITVQLYTYRYDPITNTTAYYPNVAVSVYSKAADQSTPGAFPLGTGLTGPNGTVFIKGLPVESPAAYPYGQPYHIYFSPLGAGSDVSGTLQGIAAYKGGSDCGFPASDVNVAAGGTQAIVCKMPPFAGINGRINPTLTPTGTDPGDWHDVTLNVFDNNTPSTLLYSLKYDPNSAQNSFKVGYYSTNNGSFWAWSVLLPPGNYRFEMVPDNVLRKNYLPHWYVSAASNGASAADAIVANLVPDFAQSNANFNFLPGGVLSVKVTDDTGQVLQASTVAYYATTVTNTCDYSGQPQFSIPVASQGPLTGYAYSIPYSGSLCILATPPPNSPYQTNKAGPFSLSAGGQVTIVTYTIQLKPTPFVSGYVRVRTFDGVTSYETPIISASVVAVDLNDQAIFGSAATSDGNGFYRLPLPTGAFKLLFVPVSGTINYRPRYWVSTAAQNGTPSFDQAEVIVPVPGKTYANYNQIYDVNQIGNTDCQIINPYVSSLTHDSGGVNYLAQVVFYTTCPGDTRVTYNNVPTIVNGTTVTNSQQLSVFTHTYSVGPLAPNSNGTNYYLYPSSNMVYIANQGTANETRTSEFITATTPLQVFVPADKAPTSGSAVDGTNWFFAQGQTSSAANSGISETLFLANYHPAQASVVITYYGAQGKLGTKSLILKANSRLDINLDDPTDPNSLASILVNGAPYYGKHSTWVQSNSPIVVERLQTAAGTVNGYPYRGGYDLAGATTPATTAWFPDIRTFSTYQQSVAVFNPNSITVCVSQFYNLPFTGTVTGGAQPISIPDGYLVVPPFSQRQIDPNYVIHSMIGDQAPGLNRFSLQLRSVIDTNQGCTGTGGAINPIVAELQTFYADPSGATYYRGVNGMMGGQTESQTWYLLDGQSDKVTSDQYIITNKSGLPTTVTITFQVDNPISPSVSVISQTSFTIAPRLRYDYTVPFTQLNRSLVGRQVGFTSRIDADQSVVVLRSAKYVYNSAQLQTGLYQELGVTQPSDEWLFAAGDTSASADGQAVTDEGFNLYNPNLETVVVSFTYYYRVSGSTVPTQAVFGSYILPALSRTTIKPALPNNDIGGLQPYSSYPSVGVNKYFAVQVNSSRAVFAERVLYFTKPGGKYGGNASYGWNPPPGSR